MDRELRVAGHYLFVVVAWPFAVMNAARLFHWVDVRHQYFAPSLGIAVSMALAAGPVIFLGVYERLRRRGVAAETSLCASAAVLCGVYGAVWLVSLVLIGRYSFS
jgi:hypothetical protein